MFEGKCKSVKINLFRNGNDFNDPFTNSSIKQINHHGKFENNQRSSLRRYEDDFSLENIPDRDSPDVFIKQRDRKSSKQNSSKSNNSYQPHSRLSKSLYYA